MKFVKFEVCCGSEKIVTHLFVTSRTIKRRLRNKKEKEKINFVKLFINIYSFETQFFIFSTIKNTGQVFRVI